MAIQAIARIFLVFEIQAITGLHIGGTSAGIEIGGVDNAVIRDPLTQRPYIPGSSLKGKIRSLLEKQLGLEPNVNIGGTRIHSADNKKYGEEHYRNCPVCQVFGVAGNLTFGTPTRLLVRDTLLSDESEKTLKSPDVHTDLPYTEVKTEVSIDRITSAANPRPVERVPAGAVFGPGEMVYTVYSSNDGRCDPLKDVEHLGVLFEGMALLEHDYLGGMGSRGSGKVAFQNLKVSLRQREDYLAQPTAFWEFPGLGQLMAEKDALLDKIKQSLGLSE